MAEALNSAFVGVPRVAHSLYTQETLIVRNTSRWESVDAVSLVMAFAPARSVAAQQ